MVGRYPRLSAHPTNDRKQENIKRGTVQRNSHKQFGQMLEHPSIFRYSLAVLRAVKILKCGQSAGKARKRTLRDYMPDSAKADEDIVRSAWRHAGTIASVIAQKVRTSDVLTCAQSRIIAPVCRHTDRTISSSAFAESGM